MLLSPRWYHHEIKFARNMFHFGCWSPFYWFCCLPFGSLSKPGADPAPNQFIPQLNPTSPVTHHFSFISPLQPLPGEMQFRQGFSPRRGGTGHLGRSSANWASQLSSAWPWVLPASSSAYDASDYSFILAKSFPTHGARRGLPNHFYTQTCHSFACEDAPLLCSDLHHGYKACLE